MKGLVYAYRSARTASSRALAQSQSKAKVMGGLLRIDVRVHMQVLGGMGLRQGMWVRLRRLEVVKTPPSAVQGVEARLGLPRSVVFCATVTALWSVGMAPVVDPPLCIVSSQLTVGRNPQL